MRARAGQRFFSQKGDLQGRAISGGRSELKRRALARRRPVLAGQNGARKVITAANQSAQMLGQ